MATPEAIRKTNDETIQENAAAVHSTGEVIQLDSGVAGVYVGLADSISGDPATFAIRGVYTCKKDSTLAFTAGDNCDWSNSASNVVATGDFYVGQAIAAAGVGTTTIDVRINAAALVS